MVAAGGLLKNTFLMQLYSDVIRLPLSLAVSNYASALGSAIDAAVAAGANPYVPTAAQHMGQKIPNAYQPNEEASVEYDKRYAEYAALHDYFGRGEPRPVHGRQERPRVGQGRRHARGGGPHRAHRPTTGRPDPDPAGEVDSLYERYQNVYGQH